MIITAQSTGRSTRAGWTYILNDFILLHSEEVGAEPVAGDMSEQQRKLSVQDPALTVCGSMHSKSKINLQMVFRVPTRWKSNEVTSGASPPLNP